jgi:hypothetical protein
VIALHSFGELVMRHKGARICVMGGGTRLAEDLRTVDADIWISSNEHGAKLRPVDYVLAMDNLHTGLKVPMEGHIRAHTDAPIIGPWHWCDYGLTTYPLAPRLLLSGVIATWAAHMMGAHPVILAGFDCYGGTPRSVNQHGDYVPHLAKCQVRVASGPLLKFWKQYSPEEEMPNYVPPDVFVESSHGVRVRVIKPVEIRGNVWPAGSVLHVPKAEVWRQIKHRSLEELPEESAPEAPARARLGALAERYFSSTSSVSRAAPFLAEPIADVIVAPAEPKRRGRPSRKTLPAALQE